MTPISWDRAMNYAYVIAKRRGLSHEDAEDVAQTTCEKLLKLPEWGMAHVVKAATWTVADVFLKGALVKKPWDDLRAPSLAVPLRELRGVALASPEDPLVLSSDLQKALEGLPASEREVIVAHVVEGKSLRDIAKEHGMARLTARRMYTRGIEKLRESLPGYHEDKESPRGQY